jgi:hypothetical protein
MIDKLKKHEELYLKKLKEHFSSFDQTQSLEHELNEVEETFRQPNLLIQTIREMQQKQEKSLKDIQFRLYEMTKVNDNLKVTNQFKPNLYLFNNQNESCLFFGSIKLDLYSNMNSFKSEILNGERQSFELIDLCEFSPNDIILNISNENAHFVALIYNSYLLKLITILESDKRCIIL